MNLPISVVPAAPAKHNQPCCSRIVKWFYPNFRDFWAVSWSNSTVRLCTPRALPQLRARRVAVHMDANSLRLTALVDATYRSIVGSRFAQNCCLTTLCWRRSTQNGRSSLLPAKTSGQGLPRNPRGFPSRLAGAAAILEAGLSIIVCGSNRSGFRLVARHEPLILIMSSAR